MNSIDVSGRSFSVPSVAKGYVNVWRLGATESVDCGENLSSGHAEALAQLVQLDGFGSVVELRERGTE